MPAKFTLLHDVGCFLEGTMRKSTPCVLWLNVAVLLGLPPAMLVLVPWYLIVYEIHRAELVAMGVLWALTGLGITAGYHRLFTHRSWAAPPSVRAVLSVLGGAAWENSVIEWAADHREHHSHEKTAEDPYATGRGFWASHLGWALVPREDYDLSQRVSDLWEDPICRWQNRYYLPITLAFYLPVPLLLGLCTDRIGGMILFAGLVRIVVIHQTTFLINSAYLMWGGQSWSSRTSARDNWMLAFLSLGEGYHNYHHAHPRAYRNGCRWYHFDPTKWVIWLLSKLGLAENLRRTSRGQSGSPEPDMASGKARIRRRRYQSLARADL